jgi:hypothetical protein
MSYPDEVPGIVYPGWIEEQEQLNTANNDFTESEALSLFYTKPTSDSLYVPFADPTISNPLVQTNTTTSTGPTNGSIRTAGGLGVSLRSSFGGDVRVYSTTQSNDNFTGAITTAGGVGIEKNLHVGGATDLDGVVTLSSQLNSNSVVSTTNGSSATIGTLASGALRVTGGVSIGGDLQCISGRFHAGASTTGAPGFCFSNQPGLGLNRISANILGIVANSAVMSSFSPTGSYIVGKLGIGVSVVPVDTFYVGANDAVLSTTITVNSTASGSVRNIIQSNNGNSYTVYDNTSAGFTAGILPTSNNFAIGANSALPSGKTNAITINQSNVVSLLSSATINSITQHSIFVSGTTAISGVSPLITNNPLINFNIVRQGRMVHLSFFGQIFDATAGAGNTVSISIQDIFAQASFTTNSLPENRSFYTVDDDEVFIGPCSTIRNNGGFDSSTAFISDATTLATSSLRITSQTGNFTGAVNWILGQTFSWCARNNAL